MFKSKSKQIDYSKFSKYSSDFKAHAVERFNWLKAAIKAKKVEVIKDIDSEDDVSEIEFAEGNTIDVYDSKMKCWFRSTVMNDLGDMIKICKEEVKFDNTNQTVRGEWV